MTKSALIAAALLNLVAYAQAEEPQKPESKTFQIQGVSFTTTREATETSVSNKNGTEPYSVDTHDSRKWTGRGVAYDFKQLKASRKPGFTTVRVLEGSAGYERGTETRTIDEGSSLPFPCATDPDTGSRICGVGGDPTGRIQNWSLERINTSGHEYTPREANRTSASGRAGYGVIFGSKGCGAYVGGNFSAAAKATQGFGPDTTGTVLSGQGEGGLGCAGEVVTLLTGVFEASHAAGKDGGVGTSSNAHAEGAKLELTGEKLRLRLQALREHAVGHADTGLLIPGETVAGKYSAAVTYRPAKHFALQGDAYHIRNAGKDLPDPYFYGFPTPVGNHRDTGVTVKATIAF